MARLISFVGRTLFAFLFLTSGLQKLQHFDIASGGPDMVHVEPRLDKAIVQLEEWAGSKFPISKVAYPYFLLVATVLELLGGILFVFGSKIGAQFLLLFLIIITPIMHAFWDLPPESPEQLNDMINFFKNVALAGALLFYIGN